MSLEEKLKDFLEKGKDWERIRTTIKGIFILKIPKSKVKVRVLYKIYYFS